MPIHNELEKILTWLLQSSTEVSTWILLLVLILGALIALAPISWSKTNLLSTWAHEIGHAVTALVLGRGVKKIVIRKDGSGYTEHEGENKKIRLALISFAGYPSPGFFGLTIILGVTYNRINIIIAAISLLAIITLILQRSILALGLTISILLASTILVLVPETISVCALTAVAGYLLLSSPKTIIALHENRKINKQLNKQNHSDASDLAKMTKIPSIFWETIFMIVSLVLIYVSTYFLIYA